jgi:RNA polymerase sigma-70 factor (ECF subfamily)
MEDAHLLQEIRKGNVSLYKEIIVRYQSLIASTIIGMVGHCPEADDIGQEVFIRFFKAINNFRGDAAVGTYLTRIAINLSLNELKRRQRQKRLFRHPDDEKFDLPDDSKSYEVNENKELVQRAIQLLPEKFRSVVVLRLIDGYSTEETAKILKIPLGTVLSRLTRGQQKLKQILSPIMEVNNE